LLEGRGYTAPEYVIHGLLREKYDVYSYVIVVLEIMSGRKCVDERLPALCNFFCNWFVSVLRIGLLYKP